MREWWHRLKGTLSRREALAEELRAEMDAQLEMEIEENLSRGMTPEEARVAARRAFGNRAQIQERAVEAWAFRELEILIQDFGYGARMLWRNPGVTAVAVLSLGLGMGASTAIFGIAHALMFRALPVRQPEELVVVRVDDPWHDTPNYGVPYTMFGAQETLAPFFAGIAGVGPVDRSNVIVRPKRAGDGPGFTDPEPVHFSMVSGNYFPLLGLQARLGRTITADDDRRAGGHPVAVISHRYWERRLGGDAEPIGRILAVNGTAFTIIGVMPANFTGHWVGRPTDVWVPAAMWDQVVLERPIRQWNLAMIGRLKPGADRGQAQAAAQALFQRVRAEISGARPGSPAYAEFAQYRVTLESMAAGYSPQREKFAQ